MSKGLESATGLGEAPCFLRDNLFGTQLYFLKQNSLLIEVYELLRSIKNQATGDDRLGKYLRICRDAVVYVRAEIRFVSA